MMITKEVQEISNLPAGRDLDRRVAEAIGWKCLAECLQPCDHIPLYSTQPGTSIYLRIAMEKLGWESEDKLTWMGWGHDSQHPWGYSFWFKKWVKHVQYVLVSTIHDPEKAPLVIARCALLAMLEPEVGMYASTKEVETARKARDAKRK
jgi:hypothetical protein